jgi:uncharacterized protein (UPF0332 family)
MNEVDASAALMAKAERACKSARALLELGDVDGACNRAYYAMFDAARAALLATGTADPGKTHNGLMSAFALHLVKSGVVPVEYGRMLKRAAEIRLIADYRGDSIEAEDANLVVEQADAFVATMRAIVMDAR